LNCLSEKSYYVTPEEHVCFRVLAPRLTNWKVLIRELFRRKSVVIDRVLSTCFGRLLQELVSSQLILEG